MNKLRQGVCTGLLILVSGASSADDLTGARELLCTSIQATVCVATGQCESGMPWNWNVPQFIEVDLKKKTLNTTEASGENRVTPINNTVRADGLIVLQGFERGRAFSFAIDEETGVASISVARNGIPVSVFGACTPNS